MLHEFERSILSCWPAEKWTGLTVLVACSGGADSIALLTALARLSPPLTTLQVAHFNHRLRGDASEADEAFVRQLAANLNLQCFVDRAHSSAGSAMRTDEAALRAMRYDFFERTAMHQGARYVATAHQANDQVETVLHRWCRGAGLRGLSGIRRVRTLADELVLVRPMLQLWRSDVEQYLRDCNQTYRTDASNASLDFTRNRIRNTIIPELEKSVHVGAALNILQSAETLASVLEWLQQQSQFFIDQHVVITGSQVRILLSAFRALPQPVATEAMRLIWTHQKWALRDMSRHHWNDLQQRLGGISVNDQRKLTENFPGNISLKIELDVATLEKN